jgi:hypothetical protein
MIISILFFLATVVNALFTDKKDNKGRGIGGF